jgi:hypothetical protein
MSEVQLNYATSSGAPSDVIDVEAEGSTRDLKKKGSDSPISRTKCTLSFDLLHTDFNNEDFPIKACS